MITLETLYSVLNFMYNPYIYFISLFYCIYRMVKRHKKVSLDGVIGANPASEMFVYILFPTFIAGIDIIVTFINKIIKWKKI